LGYESLLSLLRFKAKCARVGHTVLFYGKIKMFAELNGQVIDCADVGIWDSRMSCGSRRMPIRSYYPDIGRGNIEHNTVSYESANSHLTRYGKKSLFEKLLGWLDV